MTTVVIIVNGNNNQACWFYVNETRQIMVSLLTLSKRRQTLLKTEIENIILKFTVLTKAETYSGSIA